MVSSKKSDSEGQASEQNLILIDTTKTAAQKRKEAAAAKRAEKAQAKSHAKAGKQVAKQAAASAQATTPLLNDKAEKAADVEMADAYLTSERSASCNENSSSVKLHSNRSQQARKRPAPKNKKIGNEPASKRRKLSADGVEKVLVEEPSDASAAL